MSFFLFSLSLPFLQQQTRSVKSLLRSPFWSQSVRQVGPTGRTLVTRWLVGWAVGRSIVPLLSTLRKHLAAKRCFNTALHVVTEQQRDHRDCHLGMAALERWKHLITILSKSNVVWITKATLISGCFVRTSECVCDEWFLDGIGLRLARRGPLTSQGKSRSWVSKKPFDAR